MRFGWTWRARWTDQQGSRGLIGRFVKDGAVEPDDAFAVLLDFRIIGMRCGAVVRREVAVRHRVFVAGRRRVNVLRGKI
jgi:hypothetical protein